MFVVDLTTTSDKLNVVEFTCYEFTIVFGITDVLQHN